MDTRNGRKSSDLYGEEQVKRVLVGAGVDIEFEVDSDYIIFCPFHNNYRTPAGEVAKETGIFFCFSCQETKTLIELVMHVSGRSYFESIRFIESKKIDLSIEQIIDKTLFSKPDYVPFDELMIKRLNNQAIESPRAMRYFESRLISPSSVNKFLLGYSDKQDMVTVPVHSPDGTVVGFVGRSIEGKEFKNTPGLPKAKVLFNLHRVKKQSRIYVVESSFDAIRLDQVGLSAVATLGANISKVQIGLLEKYFNDIVVIADNDDAGGNMKSKIMEKLGSRVSVVNLPTKYKDIGDMDNETLKKIESKVDDPILAMLQ